MRKNAENIDKKRFSNSYFSISTGLTSFGMISNPKMTSRRFHTSWWLCEYKKYHCVHCRSLDSSKTAKTFDNFNISRFSNQQCLNVTSFNPHAKVSTNSCSLEGKRNRQAQNQRTFSGCRKPGWAETQKSSNFDNKWFFAFRLIFLLNYMLVFFCKEPNRKFSLAKKNAIKNIE